MCVHGCAIACMWRLEQPLEQISHQISCTWAKMLNIICCRDLQIKATMKPKYRQPNTSKEWRGRSSHLLILRTQHWNNHSERQFVLLVTNHPWATCSQSPSLIITQRRSKLSSIEKHTHCFSSFLKNNSTNIEALSMPFIR